MSVWAANDILRFLADGESDFCDQYPCIIDRLALSIQPYKSDYTLPDYVTNIKRVTYKGIKCDPMPHRFFRSSFQGAGTETGKPYWYIYNNVGQGVIKLFPIPVESLGSVTSGLWDVEIENRCIVEYWRTPDEENGFEIPRYLKRRLLKLYVLRQCFSMENQGQNLKAVKYFDTKWANWSKLYGSTMNSLLTKPRKLVIADPGTYQSFPRSPILPIDKYGIGVNTGE